MEGAQILPRERMESIVNEYLESEDVDDVAAQLYENPGKPGEITLLGLYLADFVKYAVMVGIDRHDRERELISQLLSMLYGKINL